MWSVSVLYLWAGAKHTLYRQYVMCENAESKYKPRFAHHIYYLIVSPIDQ